MNRPDDPLGAFCAGHPVTLDGADSGLLDGFDFAAKDNFDVAGFVTGAGNPDWRRTHPPATETASSVRRLLAAGANLRGKTIMDELAFGSLGQNRHYGTPLNSAAPDRVPGGSSSGSASAVAGSVVDFALGTDSACSVRLPASFCGLYGIRPTHGRVDIDGVVPLSPSLDTIGWLSANPDIMLRVGQALLNGDRCRTKPTRLLYLEDAFALAPSHVAEVLAASIERVAAKVGECEPIEIGEPNTDRAVGLFALRSATLQLHEVWDCHGDWIERTNPDSVVLNLETLATGAQASEHDRSEARRAWDALRTHIRERLGGATLFVLPTAIGAAPPRGLEPKDYQPFTFPTFSLLSIAVIAGLPQITLPLAELDGLPIGLSLIGEAGSDEHLLELAVDLAGGLD